MVGRQVTLREAAPLLGYAQSSLPKVMARHPERWPVPVGRRTDPGKRWAYVYDLDELLAVARPRAERPGGRPFRNGATASDDETGLIVCRSCGHTARNLTRHLRSAHDMSASDYRAAHDLPGTAAIVADSTRAALRESGRRRHDAGTLHLLDEPPRGSRWARRRPSS